MGDAKPWRAHRLRDAGVSVVEDGRKIFSSDFQIGGFRAVDARARRDIKPNRSTAIFNAPVAHGHA
jgi:hypothetical protein